MLTVISAVHNLLPMNRIFADALRRYTRNQFELIIIDNHSTDGTRDFFQRAGARVIENEANLLYPICQNQGIRAARHDILVFLNNDIIVAPDWDLHLLDIMRIHGLDILTPCGIERAQSRLATRYYTKKWDWIRHLLQPLGNTEKNLRRMHRIMYGNWEKFSRRRFSRFGNAVCEGFVGHSIWMTRAALEKVGEFDEKILRADFDLYARSKKRSLDSGDMKPMHLALGVFHHHYTRLTCRVGFEPIKDRDTAISFNTKWPKDERWRLLKDLRIRTPDLS
jgi:GT2 family glycosyltransferase